MPPLEDRSELLFVFDATDINPNGDPLNENKPRMDEETGHCLVSDVRLKRTIRDYLSDHKGEEIFVREVRKEDDNLATKEDIVRELWRQLGHHPREVRGYPLVRGHAGDRRHGKRSETDHVHRPGAVPHGA
jgi:Cas7 group CRISPR-associated protein Csh2